MTICLSNSFNISKRNLTRMSCRQEKSHKSSKSSDLNKISYCENISLKNYRYLIDKIDNNNNCSNSNYNNDNNNNDNEIGNSVINFNEKDFNRLEIQHQLFRIIWNSNFSVPLQHQLSSGRVRALEVGSSPSIWSLNMASEFPSSTFIGIENIPVITAAPFSKLSSYYSSKISEPRNATVLQTNSTFMSLPFPDETFDLVYHKSSIINPLSQSLQNPLNTLNQMIRVLKPGGWLEFMIIEKQWYNLGPITKYLKNSYLEFLSSSGINYIECTYFERYLSLRDDLSYIRKQTRETPIGSFGGRICEFLGEILLSPIKLNKYNLCLRMKISEKKFDELFNTMLIEINQYKTFCKSLRLYAKKSVIRR